MSFAKTRAISAVVIIAIGSILLLLAHEAAHAEYVAVGTDDEYAVFGREEIAPSNVYFDFDDDRKRRVEGEVGFLISDWEEYRDDLTITIYQREHGRSYKKIHEETFDGSFGTAEIKDSFFARQSKYNTRYDYKAVIRTKAKGYTSTTYCTNWTLPKTIKAKSVRKVGSTYKWKKVKNVKGYVVEYKYKKYVGKNKYGTDTFEIRYRAKTVAKPKATLKTGQKLVAVHPYAKHSGQYYCADSELTTKKGMVAFFNRSWKVYA